MRRLVGAPSTHDCGQVEIGRGRMEHECFGIDSDARVKDDVVQGQE
jgi:hypothetical protein